MAKQNSKPRQLNKQAAPENNGGIQDAESLVNQLKETTEFKSPGEQAGDFEDPDTFDLTNTGGTPGNIDTDDFAEEPAKPSPQNPAPTVTAKNLLSPETSADIVIGIIDQVQLQLFTALNKWKTRRKIGNKEEFETFMEVCQAIDDGITQFENLDIPERAKVRIAQRMLKRIDQLPFTDDEWDRMAEALALIMQEMPQYQLPPSWGFALALSQALIPRAVDVMLD